MPHEPSSERLASELWPRQRDAADCVLNAFAMGYERQQVHMACGTGKTHLAVHVAHEIVPDSRSLTVMPTLELLNQTARVWYTSGRPGRYIGLCSEERTSEAALDNVITMTGDAQALATLVRTTDGPVSVFATYASLPKIVEAHRFHMLPRWDIAVVDEAHRTAGALGKAWAVIHDNDAIPARHRLYLTATPRLWNSRRGITIEPVASMDDISLYGPVAYRYSLAEAIHEGRLADYRIVAPEIHDPQLRAFLAGRNRSRTPQADAMRVGAAQLALIKAREDHGIRRAVVFSRSIAQSEVFAQTLPETAAAVPGSHADGLWAASIHSHQSRHERRERLARFARPPYPAAPGAQADLNVLCNVRLCVEGVDFPLADAVLFADPKQSTIDIVQAIGRALRIGPGMNKIATLVIPVLFGPGQGAEEATFGTPYHLLHQVMIALKAYDEHFFHRLPVNGTPLLLPAPVSVVRPERVREIAPHLMLRVMDPEPDVWETGMANAQRFFEAHGHLNVPSNYVAPDGFHLGCWLGYQRALKAAGNLSAPRAAALATCNMVWAHAKDSTESYLETAQDYAHRHGHLVPEPALTHQGRPLGQWLAQQRDQDDAGALPVPYRRALESIDPWWNPSWPRQWQRMCAAARTRKTALNLSPGPLPRDADTLTRWLDEQFDLFPALARGQRNQLAALPLQDDPLALGLRHPADTQAATHAQGLRAARRFFRARGHLRVPADCTDNHHGYLFFLGQWIEELRVKAAAGLLSEEETDSLDVLSMEWTLPADREDDPATAPDNPAGTQAGNDQAGEPEQETTEYTDKPWRHLWVTDADRMPAAMADLVLHGGGRILIDMPAGSGKTTVAAVTADRTQARACLVLGPDPAYLRHVIKTWSTVRHRAIAAVNLHLPGGGKKAARLTSAAQLAQWADQQPAELLVVARYQDAGLIAQSHLEHHLKPWDHLVVEDAHRTAEGAIGPDHPHALIHHDDGILAYNRLYLTATPRIPHELPLPTSSATEPPWAVDMTAQEIFGTHHKSVKRRALVDDDLLSPYRVVRTQVPEQPNRWRAQAIGLARVIEHHTLRRVVALLESPKEAQEFGCQLAVQMLDAEIRVPSDRPSQRRHNQPVIHCQTMRHPMPPDIDALALPSDTYTTMDLVNALSPVMGQHVERAEQTTIIVPEPFTPPGTQEPERPAVMRRIAAALWAHDPARSAPQGTEKA
ncbi:Helicase associated domain protein [Kitasatospora sp. NPDC057198]|uniref:Helicase associated domain protein n=1 Tax=Kitasatospora sp. NPDC057198 TaxID=3346046 RepID=UPI0036383005